MKITIFATIFSALVTTLLWFLWLRFDPDLAVFNISVCVSITWLVGLFIAYVGSSLMNNSPSIKKEEVLNLAVVEKGIIPQNKVFISLFVIFIIQFFLMSLPCSGGAGCVIMVVPIGIAYILPSIVFAGFTRYTLFSRFIWALISQIFFGILIWFLKDNGDDAPLIMSVLYGLVVPTIMFPVFSGILSLSKKILRK